MNPTLPAGRVSDVPWPSSGERAQVPHASMLSARTTVRDHPLASVFAALALGVVIARLAR